MKKLILFFLLLTINVFSQNEKSIIKTDTVYEWEIKNNKDSILLSKKIILPNNTFKKIFFDSDNGEEYMRTINRKVEINLPIPGWEEKSLWIKIDTIENEKNYDYDEFGYPEILTTSFNEKLLKERIEKIYKETKKGWLPVSIKYPSEKYDFKYDKKANLIQITKFDSNGFPEKIFTYQNNKIKNISNQNRVIEEYIYDNNDQLIRKEDRTFIYRYNYNHFGEVSTIEKLTKSSQIKVKLTKLNYSNGKLKSVKEYLYAKSGTEKNLIEHNVYINN